MTNLMGSDCFILKNIFLEIRNSIILERMQEHIRNVNYFKVIEDIDL